MWRGEEGVVARQAGGGEGKEKGEWAVDVCGEKREMEKEDGGVARNARDISKGRTDPEPWPAMRAYSPTAVCVLGMVPYEGSGKRV